MTEDLKSFIKEQASLAGFDQSAFVRIADLGDSRAGLDDYLAKGHHGSMDWMATHAERRGHPHSLWPDARSIIVLGMNYGPEIDPMENLVRRTGGNISVYARGKDYHDLVKKRLKRVARAFVEKTGSQVKVFVDTAPVMEKPLGQASGLGWQGKHTNLVSQKFGSWLFLGEIFTSHDLDGDESSKDHCGSCQRCMDICPTKAFPAPYKLDARRCISYLTIEYKGHIAPEFRKAMGNRIYGCDDCLAICPWNRFAKMAQEAALLPRAEMEMPPLDMLASLDDTRFRSYFSGSPVKRTGRDRFVRNCLIAIGNSGDPTLAKSATSNLDDPSPLVRAMAIWACRQLLDEAGFNDARSRYLPSELDDAVRLEWQDLEVVS